MYFSNLMNVTKKYLSSFFLILMEICILLLLFIVLLGILDRLFLNFGFAWIQEISQFILLWVTFSGLVCLTESKSGYAVNLLINRLQNIHMKCFFKILYHGMILLVALQLLYFGFQLVIDIGYISVAPGSSIQMSYVYSIVPVSGLFICILSIVHIAEVFTTVRTIE